MKQKFQVSTPIAENLLDYIKTLGKDFYNLNCRLIVQSAYNYCTTDLTKEELEEKMAEVAKKYYKMFIHRQKTKLIQVDTVEPMKKYHANNLITLYILVFLQDHEDVLDIDERNRFNVQIED